jgi:hypothetical protein
MRMQRVRSAFTLIPDESGIIVKIDGPATVNFDIDESGNVRINP